jgi:hypothetical protein
LGRISTKSPRELELWKISQVALSLTLSIGQFLKHGGRSFPGDFPALIKIAHRISPSFVLP